MKGQLSLAEPVVPLPENQIQQELEGYIDGTDELLNEISSQFDPLRGPTVQKRQIRVKALSEAALYSYIAEQCGNTVPANLRDLLVQRANDPEYYSHLRRDPGNVVAHGYPMVYASSIGELDPQAEQALTDVLAWPSGTPAGLPPSRQLDHWHLYTMYGYDEHDLDYEQLLEYGYVRKYLNPARAGQNTLFGLTHEILYYHNFGCENEEFPDGTLTYEYPAVFTGSILRYMIEGHVDLVTELLFCGVIQRQIPPGFVRFVLGWVLTHVNEDGYLTFPMEDAGALESFVGADLSDWEGDGRTWRAYYHPTLVAGMFAHACADHWPQVSNTVERRTIDYRHHADDLLTLGAVLSLLAEYTFDRALDRLEEIVDSPVVDAYPGIVEHVTSFLSQQRRADGMYGAWTDERMLYQRANDNAPDTFDAELIKPLSERCERVLEELPTQKTRST